VNLTFCVACGATDDLQHRHLVTEPRMAAMTKRTSSPFASHATRNCMRGESMAPIMRNPASQKIGQPRANRRATPTARGRKWAARTVIDALERIKQIERSKRP
jgi:hypothetical protein